MTTETIGQMTQSEFKKLLETVIEATVEQKLLEILGDPDDTLEIQNAVRERLTQQMVYVTSGEYGKPIEDVIQDLGLE
ncbi:MAG: hypothetical protein U9R58_15385 [Chloroflexota bacterium]|nr:hypothetical protein [Chloroflexota bacterium]